MRSATALALCTVLQRVAVCYSVLQRVAVWYTYDQQRPCPYPHQPPRGADPENAPASKSQAARFRAATLIIADADKYSRPGRAAPTPVCVREKRERERESETERERERERERKRDREATLIDLPIQVMQHPISLCEDLSLRPVCHKDRSSPDTERESL